jgi:hypothetical protein
VPGMFETALSPGDLHSLKGENEEKATHHRPSAER